LFRSAGQTGKLYTVPFGWEESSFSRLEKALSNTAFSFQQDFPSKNLVYVVTLIFAPNHREFWNSFYAYVRVRSIPPGGIPRG
jgi:hypothetical protein